MHYPWRHVVIYVPLVVLVLGFENFYFSMYIVGTLLNIVPISKRNDLMNTDFTSIKITNIIQRSSYRLCCLFLYKYCIYGNASLLLGFCEYANSKLLGRNLFTIDRGPRVVRT